MDHLFRGAYVVDYSIVPLGLPLSTRKLRKKAATTMVLGVGVEGRRNLKILTLGNGVQHLPMKVTYNIKTKVCNGAGAQGNLSFTVQILCIGTDRSQQTAQTKIRLLLKKQSDQGLCCLPFHQHLLDALMQCYIKLFYF